MLPEDLISKINSGRCFLLVGAGPSCELGYPSWHNLAEHTKDYVAANASSYDKPTYEGFLKSSDYPALFREAELNLGSRQHLVDLLKRLLVRGSPSTNFPAYRYLAKWPFACYFTTNFDDELSVFLRRERTHFTTLQNTQADLSSIRADSTQLIIKAHADLDHADQAIITSRDYDRLVSSAEWEYLRSRLRAFFEMFDFLILGHSMSDPDLRLILQIAKHTTDPLHPIYMILPDATNGMVREFLEKYNIRLITYKNFDQHHVRLKRILSLADHFICSRQDTEPPPHKEALDELVPATSLLLFNRLQSIATDPRESHFIDPLVLGSISANSEPSTIDEIVNSKSIKYILQHVENMQATLRSSLERLLQEQRVKRIGLDRYQATESGQSEISRIAKERETLADQAYGQFCLDLSLMYDQLTKEEEAEAKSALESVIVHAFRERGLALASRVLTGQSLASQDLPDIFRIVSLHAARFSRFDLRAAFIDCARKFLLEPTSPQRIHLSTVSQGFFLYHLAGQDAIRSDIFSNTYWLVDSSILLPLLARGCANHSFALDFFTRLSSCGARLCTTDRLLREVLIHYDWAVSFVAQSTVESPEFLQASMASGTYKQNLFLDGFIRLAADGECASFGDYVDSLIAREHGPGFIDNILSKYNISVLDLSNIEGFDQNDWGDFEYYCSEVQRFRQDRGTFRSMLQVESEAEALVIIRNTRNGRYRLSEDFQIDSRLYFVSHSALLNKFAGSDIVTWTPEAVYRYANTIHNAKPDADLLQQCMLNEYYYVGVSVIDRLKYVKYFGPSINLSKIKYSEQVANYLAHTEQQHRRPEYDRAFDQTPDLEKPFFVAQMGWQLASKAEAAATQARQEAVQTTEESLRRILEADARAKVAEEELKANRRELASLRKLSVTAEQEAARIRNSKDPRHLKKRIRQAKRRKKKGG